MRFWVGVTDNDWFRYHARHRADEVYFWQSSGRAPFGERTLGMPLDAACEEFDWR